MNSALVRAAALATALVAAGCSSLLPHSQTVVRTEWSTFDEAKATIERLEPHRTNRAELRSLGLDPYTNPNVELLNYSDVLRRFPLAGPIARLDPGLRECLEAGASCTGYSIDLRNTRKERVGPFLLDLFGFRRVTKTTGWTFNAIVLVVGDNVVYSLYGGKRDVSETDDNVEPLGPLQNLDASRVVR